MTQLGEGVSIPTVDKPEEKEEEIKSVKIRYSVFFDGTLNNKANIDARLVSADSKDLTAEEKKTSENLKNNMSIDELTWAQNVYNELADVDSFENGYTNIVKLERHIDTAPQAPYDLGFASYIEGAGTRDSKKDKMFGYALGVGCSGVKKKVVKGVDEVVKGIKAKHSDKAVIIELLTLDTFGFSRGAAGARYFIYKALLDGKSVKEQLEDSGYKVKKVEFKFAGLFDTVSSHGLSFTNDTPALKLDSVSFVEQVVHLAAADEHREKFSLTDIQSAKSKGIQVYLPGVHSDVGGSYRDNSPDGLDGGEKLLKLFWAKGNDSEEKAIAEKKRLIDTGWYTEDEIEIKTRTRRRLNKGLKTKYATLYAGKAKVSNQYSRIPLQIMADQAVESEIKFKPALKSAEKVPGTLSKAESNIKKYFSKNKKVPESASTYTSKADDWLNDTSQWLKDLRHDCFHFSAHYSIGLSPRIKNGKRTRLVLRG
ncbi:MAG: hypothetical protein DIZ80_06905 [endosymbiont of Galathealinum brachiosum]|uniref:T6SS Phospholipase effector Tle1-like catalytic domain-containing protein n=1 Tax=endosymbiont of Galathealinum brachiosum TaxID=2200906 RepID=A0A370DG10_9GAMM|nr:MAG: hypothetical protein DIZ80_06905 [endosymbiont of Galathealinum brachiosum]